MSDTVFRDVEVGSRIADVHVRDATIVAVGALRHVPGAEVVEGRGGRAVARAA